MKSVCGLGIAQHVPWAKIPFHLVGGMVMDFFDFSKPQRPNRKSLSFPTDQVSSLAQCLVRIMKTLGYMVGDVGE